MSPRKMAKQLQKEGKEAMAYGEEQMMRGKAIMMGGKEMEAMRKKGMKAMEKYKK